MVMSNCLERRLAVWLNTHAIMDSAWLEPVLAESVNTMESGQDLLQFANVRYSVYYTIYGSIHCIVYST